MTCTVFGAPKPAALRCVLEEGKSFNTEDTKDTEEFHYEHMLMESTAGKQSCPWRLCGRTDGAALIGAAFLFN